MFDRFWNATVIWYTFLTPFAPMDWKFPIQTMCSALQPHGQLSWALAAFKKTAHESCPYTWVCRAVVLDVHCHAGLHNVGSAWTRSSRVLWSFIASAAVFVFSDQWSHLRKNLTFFQKLNGSRLRRRSLVLLPPRASTSRWVRGALTEYWKSLWGRT